MAGISPEYSIQELAAVIIAQGVSYNETLLQTQPHCAEAHALAVAFEAKTRFMDHGRASEDRAKMRVLQGIRAASAAPAGRIAGGSNRLDTQVARAGMRIL